jgi:hypothetical protein
MDDRMSSPVDLALTPAEMLALAEHEQSRAARRLTPDDRLLYGVWGGVWSVGFLGLWLTAGDDPPIDARTAAGWLFAVLMIAALATTVWHTVRRVAGVHGTSQTVGRRYGTAWGVAFVTYPMLLQTLFDADVSDQTIELLAALFPCFIVGMLYMAGGAAWNDALQFRLGAWITLTTGVAALVGRPDHLLVMALGGGGGLLVGAAFATHRQAGAS